MKNQLVYLLLLLFTGCKSNLNTGEEITVKFIANRKKFEQLVYELNNNPAIDSLYKSSKSGGVKASDFPHVISLQLSKLDISSVYIYAGCINPIKPLYIFSTNWNAKTPVMVVNNPCDSINTINKYYHKDEYNNEIWGIGDFWFIQKNAKPLIPLD
ncbi:hypothetical protein [Ferruginibacter sp. SUN106]|uniref:hypothetical protein n=1 Tax=Ferruginibacter sp. SUN106 TaxID=2978348 RepID=UPI003D36AF63